ncbi:MAG TPA: alginate lyase family protein [Candidatus Limnocylindrales bacterium]|nr:alginate lyase family protein [Candidatus Limnocylindrales bacterium]
MKRSLFSLLVVLALLSTPQTAHAADVYEAESATISQGVVESNHAGFTGTGFVNYDNVIGSYVQFSVAAPAAGTATLTLRYANGSTADRPMDIAVNGTTVATGVSFPVTGAWTTWATKTLTAAVNAGGNTVRATAASAGGGPNLDSLSVTVTTPDYQAESATIAQGVVESNHAGFTGTGFVNYDNVAGSYVEFRVTAASAGAHTLTFRFANGTADNRPMDIRVNGGLSAAAMAFPGTGAWTTWTTRTTVATLNAGTNTIRATATTAFGGPNLDRLSVAKQAGVFHHPGVLVSRDQLDVVKARVNGNVQPQRAAYDAMVADSAASLSWTPRPRAIVECGPSSNPNLGCSDEREDAIAAYTHALRWYVTGDSRYAIKAIEIMDAWSGTISDHINSNAPLQTGWAGASWSRAAEIIRHTYSGWPADRVNRFAAMLRNVYLPEISNGSPNTNGNWELIMMDAAAGIGVFLDDRAVFDKAVGIWRGRVPAYVYLTTDGAFPKPPPGSRFDTPAELVDYWQGQSTFVDGLAQETCRDFGHTGWGLAAAVHVAETARHQGLNLYAEIQARMTKALEFHANYDLGAAVPSWLCGGSVNDGLGPIAEIGYNHYATRLGLSLPKTKQLIETRLRPTGISHFLAWETLTHANNP